MISLSTTIQGRRQEYYDALARASRDTLDITEWLVWFTALVLDAQREVRDLIAHVLAKARFWERHTAHLNPRQVKVLNRMLRDGPDSFEGGINAQKYMKLTDCSKATATRDLTELLHLGALKKLPGSGRSTRYDIALPDTDLPQ